MVDGPFGSHLASQHYVDDGARVVRLGNIGSMRFKDEDRAYISMEHFRQLSRHEVLPGDLLVAGLGDENNAVGRAAIAPKGLGPALVKADCFRVRLNEKLLDSRFAGWFLNSTFAAHQMERESRGATRIRATPDAVLRLEIPYPPLDVQRRITDFLDDQVGRIDGAIDSRERQRALVLQRFEASLATMFQSLANRGQTAPLRRFLARIQTGTTPPAECFSEQGLPWYSPASIDDLGDIGHPAKLIALNYVNAVPHYPSGSVLLVGIGATAGRVGFLTHEGTSNQQLTALVTNERMEPRFLMWQLHVRRGEILAEAPFTTLPILNNDYVRSLPVVAPSKKSQRALVKEVDAHVQMVRRSTGCFEEVRSLLVERKRSLITAAVTGEFDVSSASSHASDVALSGVGGVG